MVLGGFFPAVGTLYFWMRGYTSEGRASWLGLFGNPNDVAYALVLLVPLALGLMSLGGTRARIVGAIAIVVYVAAVYTTFSRGGLLGLVAVLVVAGARVRSVFVRFLGWALLGLVLAVASLFWTRPDGFGDLRSDATLHQRVITVKAGLSMLADHPVLGVGLGCSVVGFQSYVEFGELTRGSLVVHNTFVQALAETGLLGGIPYLLLVFLSTWGAHRLASRGRGEASVLAAALCAALVGFVVCGLSGGYVTSWFPFILFGLVSALRRIAGGAAARPEAVDA
jgi:O-antigen ligase